MSDGPDFRQRLENEPRTFTADQIQEAIVNDGGFCLACGAEAFGIEQDATRYKCETCGAHQVFGATEICICSEMTDDGFLINPKVFL